MSLLNNVVVVQSFPEIGLSATHNAKHRGLAAANTSPDARWQDVTSPSTIARPPGVDDIIMLYAYTLVPHSLNRMSLLLGAHKASNNR